MNEILTSPKKVIFFLILLSVVPFLFACGGNPIWGGGDTSDPGVVINGITWATRNVDAPGTFAETPESVGMFYQWNRKVAYPITGEVTNWDTSTPKGDTWAKANDPSPVGWRVPTLDEIKSLLDNIKVRNEWTTQNGVNGYKFTDRSNGNSIFLPAAGSRNAMDGTSDYSGYIGRYWSSTQKNYPNSLNFGSGGAGEFSGGARKGISVRCVRK